MKIRRARRITHEERHMMQSDREGRAARGQAENQAGLLPGNQGKELFRHKRAKRE